MNRINRDFLLEDKFIEWRLLRTEELDDYWTNFRISNPELSDDIDFAIKEFETIKMNEAHLIEEDKKEILNSILKRKTKASNIKTFIQIISTVAAIIVIGFFISTFTNMHNVRPISYDNTIVGQTLPDEDVYIISNDNKTKLVNNSRLELTENKKAVIKSDTGELQEVNLSEASVNKLIVPFGKRSNITLSDGSRVWVNSGSQLSFPTKFEGDKREIYVDGEVYIEVKEDKNTPFIVNTGSISVQVYGTSFNLTSYSDDEVESIVLVEGQVGVKSKSHKREMMLSPNEKIDISNNTINIEVVNASEYISWTKDILEFEEATMSEILKKVGRYYNIQFENSRDIALNEQTFSGKLFLSNNLDSVMTSLSVLSSTEYERDSNVIHIKKTK